MKTKTRKCKSNNPHGNPDSLQPLTPERARVIGRAGGIASGEARREMRGLRELAEMVRDMPCKGNPKITNGMAAVVALFEQAKRGNVSAFNAIAELTHELEKPAATIIAPMICDDVPDDIALPTTNPPEPEE